MTPNSPASLLMRTLPAAGLLLGAAACRDAEPLAPATPAMASATFDAWATRAPLPEARARFGAAVLNGVLYAVGG